MAPSPFGLAFAFAPHRLSGTVYGVAVGHQATLAALGDAAHAPPYKAPPTSVVLYVKPRNTFVGPHDAVEGAADGAPLAVGATLGVVIGRVACRVSERDALDVIAGYLVAADFTVPTAQHYRPQVRAKVRDRSLVVSAPVAAAVVGPADALAVNVRVDGAAARATTRHDTTTGGTVRSIARLVADISDFITLAPGDLVLAGVAPGAPDARSGDVVSVSIDRVGTLTARIGDALSPAVGRT